MRILFKSSYASHFEIFSSVLFSDMYNSFDCLI